jgi:hypothetical protein
MRLHVRPTCVIHVVRSVTTTAPPTTLLPLAHPTRHGSCVRHLGWKWKGGAVHAVVVLLRLVKL